MRRGHKPYRKKTETFLFFRQRFRRAYVCAYDLPRVPEVFFSAVSGVGHISIVTRIYQIEETVVLDKPDVKPTADCELALGLSRLC